MKKKRMRTGQARGGRGVPDRQPSTPSSANVSPSPAPAVRPGPGGGARRTLIRLKAELAAAQRRIEELQAIAERDFLLDIVNRRGFTRELKRAVAYIRRYRTSGALIVLDVDRLKPINDVLGHAAGDQVLKAVAGALSGHVRASDVVGRLGGDEFGVLLWNVSEADARAKAAALELSIDDLTIAFGDRIIRTGASAGIAILNEDTDPDGAGVFEAADQAMYARKAQRRDRAGSGA